MHCSRIMFTIIISALLGGCTVNGPLSAYEIHDTQAKEAPISNPTTEQTIEVSQPSNETTADIAEPSLSVEEIAMVVAQDLRNIDYEDTSEYMNGSNAYLSPGYQAAFSQLKIRNEQIAKSRKIVRELYDLEVDPSSVQKSDTTAVLKVVASEQGSEMGDEFDHDLSIHVHFFRERSLRPWKVADVTFDIAVE
ncbi:MULTISPECIES: hypothetical protein [unclassified Paenibacillus]|nr:MULTISPECIES: hypothetical protein [unclassified Paenibacillus]